VDASLAAMARAQGVAATIARDGLRIALRR
jgi:hypothetical protein